MRTPSKKAWELTHSLSEVESQKFCNWSLNVNRGRKTQYLVLFFALQRQSKFDEKKLRKDLRKEKFLSHLHRVKSYLYDKILAFLRDDEKDGEDQLYAFLGNIKFLFRKRLYLHLPDQIEKAKSLAEETEDFLSHLKILNYQRMLIGVSKNWGFEAGEVQEVTLKETELRKLDAEKFELQKVLDMVTGISRIFPAQKEIDVVLSKINHSNNLQSKTALILYGRIKLNLALRMGNYNECIAEADKIISIFKDNTALLQNDSYFKDFVLAIYYAAIYRAFLKEIDESNQMINLLDSIADAKSREPSLFYEIKILYKLGAGMASLDIKMLRNTIAEFKQLPEEITANFDPVKRIEIFHIAANASIIDEKPKETLEYINCIRTVKPKYLRPDIRYYARILFLVAHFDLENFDAIETGVRAARTSYKRKMIQNPFYSAVLHMFSKIVRAQSLREKEDAIREFLAGYEGESAAIWAKMNNFFNIRAWLNSKLENRKFTDVLRQSYQL